MAFKLRLDHSKPKGEIYGDSVAKWYQAGQHFDGQGRPLLTLPNSTFRLMTEEEDAKAAADAAAKRGADAPVDSSAVLAENADLRARIAQLEGRGAQPVGTAPMPQPQQPEQPQPEPPPASYRGELEGLKTAQVKSIFTKAGGPPEIATGAGAQARMIDWLVSQSATP